MTMMTHLTSWPAPSMSLPTLPPPPRAWEIAARVRDPSRPQATIAENGILRDVLAYDQGDVHVQISLDQLPATAVEALRERLVQALCEEGFRRVDVECVVPRHAL
ncbi:hypothetical protein GCM10009668_09280 [Nocardioides dubius]|uniref:Asp23/Gls24 family envelope stress response protein n=2 Tax=Nocardioides dubius TaxID=317019 RepID=A0ABN1TQS2_9ACTN